MTTFWRILNDRLKDNAGVVRQPARQARRNDDPFFRNPHRARIADNRPYIIDCLERPFVTLQLLRQSVQHLISIALQVDQRQNAFGSSSAHAALEQVVPHPIDTNLVEFVDRAINTARRSIVETGNARNAAKDLTMADQCRKTGESQRCQRIGQHGEDSASASGDAEPTMSISACHNSR